MGDESRWRARPVAAWSLRAAILAVPLAVAWGATSATLHWLGPRTRQPAWLVVAAAVSVVTCLGVQRLARRFLPLATLLKLTMLFPDRAPSRFRVARGSTQARLAAVRSARDGRATESAEALLGLLVALSAHDRKTRGHSERVRVFTDLLADELGLPQRDRDLLRWSALIHDIGKLRVAAEILNKPSKLSGTEWEVVKAHPADGAAIAGPLLTWLGEWGQAVRHHHERYDGTGYPDGLVGAGVPRAGRIVAICDAYEVMTAARAYKKPMATRSARAELIRNAGTQFDPAYVRAFLSISLPRLLWAMGPASLLTNLPFLRTLAQLSGTAAAPQAAAAVASAAVVTVGAVTAGATPLATPWTTSHAVPPAAAGPAAPGGASAGPAAAPPGSAVPGGHGTTADRSGTGSGTTAAPTGAPAASPQGPAAPTGAGAPTVTGPGTSAPPTAPAPPVGPPVGPPPAPPTSSAAPPPPPPPPPDTTAPVVTLTGAPPPVSVASSATVSFTVDDATATAQCSLDGGPWTACSSPRTMTGLSVATHRLAVRATDPAGNVSAVVSAQWTVLALSPVVFTTKPPLLLAPPTATFAWTPQPGATYECKLDLGAWTACSTPVTRSGLAIGAHTFSVRAVAPDGRTSASTSYAWTVL